MTNCEYDTPCAQGMRDEWCRGCLNGLIAQQNDLNERLWAEVVKSDVETRRLRGALALLKKAADDVYDAHTTERSAWEGEREKSLKHLEDVLDSMEAADANESNSA